MRAGYFSTAGWTETGGLGSFLTKLRADVEWHRCFPAVNKPAPKLGRVVAAPIPTQAGTTGEPLISAMVDRLRSFWSGDRCPFDFLLVVDDADCRFEDLPAFAVWKEQVQQRVRDALGRDVPVFTLLASPEIEAWMVSDWDESFGRQYGHLAWALRRHVGLCILGGQPLNTIESFGARRPAGGCDRKLSRELEDALAGVGACACGSQANLATAGRRYRKRLDGVEMLQRIRPPQVRDQCPAYFGPTYGTILAFNPPP